MKLWKNIRSFFYQMALREKLRNLHVSRKLINLNDAKSIGLIYDSSLPDNDILVTKYAEELRGLGKTVEILGYVNDPKVDHKADITVFNKKGVSWCDVPTDVRVESFISKKFDLLIAAITSDNKPLEFIAMLSHAGWRVGPFSETNTELFDMMINTSGKTDVSYFLKQTNYFLNQIKYDTK